MNTNVAYCHVVASVLAADGIMGDQERAFLAETMDKLGLSDEERDAVMHFEGADGAHEVVKALPRAERESLRDDLLAATLADGKISPLESELMKNLTEVLDL